MEYVKKVLRFVGRIFPIDPMKPLHHLLAFWFPIFVFVGLGVVLTIPMWCFCIPTVGDYVPIFDSLKLPVLAASLAVPISVTVARIHSSKQTASTLKASHINSTFNKYYDHRKHFIEFIDSVESSIRESSNIEIINKHRLYSFIFPDSHPEEFDVRLNESGMYNQMRKYKQGVTVKFNDIFRRLNSSDDKYSQAIQCLAEGFGFRFTNEGVKTYAGYLRGTKDSTESAKLLSNLFTDALKKSSEFSGRLTDNDLITLVYWIDLTNFIAQLELRKWAVDGKSDYVEKVSTF